MAKVAKAKKPAKAAKPSKADKDKLIDEKLGELDEAMSELKVATDEWEHKHAEAAAAKKRVALVQADVNQINTDLCDIRKGRYNLRLPFPDDKAKGKKGAPGEVVDAGASQPLKVLCDHGFSAANLEKLEAGTICRTIGDLEKLMRDDAFWHTKIAGLKDARIDNLVDALHWLRRKFPHPEPAADKPADKEPATLPTIFDGGRSGAKEAAK